MSRDFAHKPRQPEGSHIPRWVWVFTSVVAVGFIAFLYFLSHVPEESGGAEAVREQFSLAMKESEQDKPTQPVVTEEHETIEDIKEKADTYKKAFEFYKLLKNDEVPIDLPENGESITPETGTTSTQVTAPTVPEAKSWIIQVASFSKVEDADRLRAELILNGLPETEIVTVEVAGKGTYHRVMVGPYSHRPSLNKAQDILAELNYQPLVKAQ